MRVLILMHFMDVMLVVATICVTRFLIFSLWGGEEKSKRQLTPRRRFENGFHSPAI
jgi:hypothetical protein